MLDDIEKFKKLLIEWCKNYDLFIDEKKKFNESLLVEDEATQLLRSYDFGCDTDLFDVACNFYMYHKDIFDFVEQIKKDYPNYSEEEVKSTFIDNFLNDGRKSSDVMSIDSDSYICRDKTITDIDAYLLLDRFGFMKLLNDRRELDIQGQVIVDVAKEIVYAINVEEDDIYDTLDPSVDVLLANQNSKTLKKVLNQPEDKD